MVEAPPKVLVKLTRTETVMPEVAVKELAVSRLKLLVEVVFPVMVQPEDPVPSMVMMLNDEDPGVINFPADDPLKRTVPLL